jgi:hypothetical protein
VFDKPCREGRYPFLVRTIRVYPLCTAFPHTPMGEHGRGKISGLPGQAFPGKFELPFYPGGNIRKPTNRLIRELLGFFRFRPWTKRGGTFVKIFVIHKPILCRGRSPGLIPLDTQGDPHPPACPLHHRKAGKLPTQYRAWTKAAFRSPPIRGASLLPRTIAFRFNSFIIVSLLLSASIINIYFH